MLELGEMCYSGVRWVLRLVWLWLSHETRGGDAGPSVTSPAQHGVSLTYGPATEAIFGGQGHLPRDACNVYLYVHIPECISYTV